MKGKIPMESRTVLRSLVITVVMFLWLTPAICQLGNESELRLIYAKMVEDCIRKCESKAKMSNSNSNNLRKAARLASLKAKYFSDYKGSLIEEMVHSELPTKPYRVHYFLNQRFFRYDASRPAFKHGQIEARLN